MLTNTPDETPEVDAAIKTPEVAAAVEPSKIEPAKVDTDREFLQGLATQDPQVRKRIFTVLLRAVVTNKGPGR